VEVDPVAVRIGPAGHGSAPGGIAPGHRGHARRVFEGTVDDQVRPGGVKIVTRDRVIAKPTNQAVGTGPPIDQIIACAVAIEGVIAIAAIDRIVAAAIPDKVVARARVNQIVAGGAADSTSIINQVVAIPP